MKKIKLPTQDDLFNFLDGAAIGIGFGLFGMMLSLPFWYR